MTLLIGLLLLCQDADVRYREQCEAVRPVFIKNAEARIESLLEIKGGRKNVIAAEVRTERKLIADLKSKKKDPIVLIDLNKPKIGQFGITSGVGVVRQVIDASNMIVDVTWVVDANGNSAQRFVWIEQPTAGIPDGQTFDPGATLFEVIGTKTYSTAVGGTKTVTHLRRFIPARPAAAPPIQPSR